MSNLRIWWEAFVKKYGITGSTLKIIAIVFMIIDHTAVIIVNSYINNNIGVLPYREFNALCKLYDIMRALGRIAFPIFCFLTVEGYCHTRNYYRYLRNLLVAALISEPIFDISLWGEVFYPAYQNVLFTLIIGLLAIHLIDRYAYDSKYNIYLRVFFYLTAALGSMAIAYYLKTDYSYKGVIAIILMYSLRKNRLLSLLAGEAIFEYEPTAFISIIPIMLYNNKRGLKLKMLFYLVYPLHLAILWMISKFLPALG
ncbi:MAG: conjugal transfer protein TraX [Lachnospiraceae bacterium]|nr:conjugal transfer protein TraX [Lachnospiraceae bacterium]